MGSWSFCLTTDCEPEKAHYLLEKLTDALENYGYDWIEAQARPLQEGEALYDVDAYGDLLETPHDELCPRCTHPLMWLTSSYHCGYCHWHAGCCEGDPQS